LENKKDILWRSYLIYIFICLLAVAIIYKVFSVQFIHGEELRSKAQEFSTKHFEIEAVRGNIYDANGSLLATSLPYYEVAMDVNTESLTDEIFTKNIDSLSFCLSKLFKDKNYKEYKRMIMHARASGSRYLVLKKDVSYPDLQLIKKFPILRKGRNRGGFIYLQTNKRERPFQFLAARTIGKINENGGKSYGLEAAFDSILKGKNGQRWMEKIAGNVWRPINDENEIEPIDGYDVVSTIDINVQDVAENSLLNCLKKHGADHGSLVLMEIKTGEVKAIVNLKRVGKDSSYAENLNYAVGVATVPGSTFKLPSLIAMMEDFDVQLNEQVEVGNGTCFYFNEKVSDSHPPQKEVYTIQEVFEQSSNVGVTKVITKYYSKDPQKYIDRLYKMNLNTPLGISIPGEGIPYIKNTEDKTWSKISLPWISYGYETRITPLQILTFYSAIANDGKMMRPLFVKEINESTFFLKYAPDYTSRVIILNRSINGCEIPFPIQNAFISESSNGMKCAIHPEFAYNFFNDADKLKNVNTFFPIKGMYASQQNHVAGDYMFALNMHNIHLSIDFNNLLKTIYFDLKKVKWPNRKIKKDNYYLFYNSLLHSSIYNILNFIFINFWTINFEINSLKLKSFLKKYFIDKYPMIQKFLELGIISKRHSCSNIIEANYKLDLLLRKWIEGTDIKSTKC